MENDQWEISSGSLDDDQTGSPTLYKDLKVSKKSARWAIKLLYKEMKKERMRTCEAIIAMIAMTS
jgi:hypothetical protein